MSVLTRLSKEGQPGNRVPLTIAERFAIFRRDNFTCVYCGKVTRSPEVDHVFPVCLGGTNNWRNLVTACWKCNRGKGAAVGDLDMNNVCSEAVARMVRDRWPGERGVAPFSNVLAGRCAYLLASLTFDDGGDIPAMLSAIDTSADWHQAAGRMLAIQGEAWIAHGSLQMEVR